MMNDHERAVFEKALRQTDHMSYGAAREAIWNAARAYEPPAVCGERGAGGNLRCVLHTGHDGAHCTESNGDNSYICWPREQEPCGKRFLDLICARPSGHSGDCSILAQYPEGGVHEAGCSAPHPRGEEFPIHATDPREQELDPDERCAYHQTTRDCGPCNVRREDHDTRFAFNAHAFVSAK